MKSKLNEYKVVVSRWSCPWSEISRTMIRLGLMRGKMIGRRTRVIYD